MTGQPGTHCPKLGTRTVCSIQLSLGSAAFYKIITTNHKVLLHARHYCIWLRYILSLNCCCDSYKQILGLHFIEEDTGPQGEWLDVFVMDCCIKNYPPAWWLKTTKYIVLLCYVNMYIVNHIAVFKALVHVIYFIQDICIHRYFNFHSIKEKILIRRA